MDAYVACFSEEEDDLGQWRLYAAGGGGYAIGVSSAAIRRLGESLGFETVEMLYGSRVQVQLVRHLLERACDLLEKIPTGPRLEEHVSGLVRSTQIDLAKCIVRAKHEGFRNEHEWRTICVVAEHPSVVQHVEFSERGGLLIPRLKLPVRDPEVNNWAIRAVSCGPTLHPVLSLEGIRALTGKFEVGCKVRRSSVPLRT
jgi:hypothetical protein